MTVHTIDEVILTLDEIIARARSERSRLGFFATLYRNVTIRVKEGIAEGLFEDDARVERLDVAFANRYLTALDSFRRGERPSLCWHVSFKAAASRRPLILQHLLLGINAHINFDLGIAAAEIAPGAQLPALKHDFEQINNILGRMLDKVRANIDELSPWIDFLDNFETQRQDKFINFSLTKARDSAWRVAERLAPLGDEEKAAELERLDRKVAALGWIIRRPGGIWLNFGLWLISLRESNDIPHIIDVLSRM
jgi:hypothetical protein